MKALIFYLVMATGFAFGVADTSSNGEREIIQYVANDFNVDEQDVSLLSPDQVLVDLGTSSEQGTATFEPYGESQTEVTIVFPSRTLNFIVENEIEGI